MYHMTRSHDTLELMGFGVSDVKHGAKQVHKGFFLFKTNANKMRSEILF